MLLMLMRIEMDSSFQESAKTSGIEVNNVNLEKAKFLWEEYKYRHEHCWKLIFQITAAIVILSIVPYTDTDIAKSLGYWIVSLPALGIVLAVFSLLRMSKELKVLDSIKNKHRVLQQGLFNIDYKNSTSTFSRDVKIYLLGLLLLSIIDIVAIIFVWIPKLKF